MDIKKLQAAAVNDLRQYRELAASDSPADQQKAAAIRRILLLLPDRERDILEQFYANREKRYAGHSARLQAKYNISREKLYRTKDKAVTNYCVCMLAAKLAGQQETRST